MPKTTAEKINATPPLADGHPTDPIRVAVALLATGPQLQPGQVIEERLTGLGNSPIGHPPVGFRDATRERLQRGPVEALSAFGETLAFLADRLSILNGTDDQIREQARDLCPAVTGQPADTLMPLWRVVADAVADVAVAKRTERSEQAAREAERKVEQERREAEAAQRKAMNAQAAWEREQAAQTERTRQEFFASRKADSSLLVEKGG